MCKFGYKYEGEGDDATCVEASEMLLAANTTEDLAFIKQQENAVAFNVFMFVAWISGFVAAAAGGTTFAYRKFRAPVPENDAYSALLACE